MTDDDDVSLNWQAITPVQWLFGLGCALAGSVALWFTFKPTECVLTEAGALCAYESGRTTGLVWSLAATLICAGALAIVTLLTIVDRRIEALAGGAEKES